MVTWAQPTSEVSTTAAPTMRSRNVRVGSSMRSAYERERQRWAGLHGCVHLGPVGLRRGLVEDVHLVVVVELEILVCHRLAHPMTVAEIAVDVDPHAQASTFSTGTKS